MWLSNVVIEKVLPANELLAQILDRSCSVGLSDSRVSLQASELSEEYCAARVAVGSHSVRVSVFSGKRAWRPHVSASPAWIRDVADQYIAGGKAPSDAMQLAFDLALEQDYIHSEDPDPYSVGTRVRIESTVSEAPWVSVSLIEDAVGVLYGSWDIDWRDQRWNWPDTPRWYLGHGSVPRTYAEMTGLPEDEVRLRKKEAQVALRRGML